MNPILLKAGGSGLETSQKLANTGEKIVLVGLILQALSYSFFCVLLVKSHISLRSDGGSLAHKSTIVLIRVLYFSSAFIIVSPPSFWLQLLPLKPPRRFAVSIASQSLLRDVRATSSLMKASLQT